MKSKKLQLKNQKLEELRCVKFFINRFNKYYRLDYAPKLNEKEDKGVDSEIDIYGISDSRLPMLKFQIVTRERILREIEPKLAHNPGKVRMTNLDTTQWISEAIDKKENHYPLSVKQKLILLIMGSIGPLLNEDYAKKVFSKFMYSKFKGIYSVHLPSTSSYSSSYLHNGQLIAIKDIFGNHGKVF